MSEGILLFSKCRAFGHIILNINTAFETVVLIVSMSDKFTLYGVELSPSPHQKLT